MANKDTGLEIDSRSPLCRYTLATAVTKLNPETTMRVAFFLLIVGVVTSIDVGYAASAGSVDYSARRIALSFDDAPKGAGPKFSGDERVARYAAAGHLIANHTHSHFWLKRTDTDQYIEDIDRAEDLLQGFENRRAWFRFPFLDEGTPRAKRDAVRAALEERGLMNGYVTVDNYDWYLDAKWKTAVDEGRCVDIEALRGVYVDMLMGAVAFFHELALESLNQSPAQVILLHENDVAAMFIGDLVTALRAEGWSIVSPDEAYADPIAKVVPKTLMTRQGHIAALAVDAGLDPRILTHLAIEETQIDTLLVERGVFGGME